MNDIEKRARELYAAQFPGDAGWQTREWIMAGTFGDDAAINAIIEALTIATKFEAQAESAIQLAQIAKRRADRAALTPPEGCVLIQATDAKALCAYVKHSPRSALAARRVEALLAARPEAK